jgi:hypothetical protein
MDKVPRHMRRCAAALLRRCMSLPNTNELTFRAHRGKMLAFAGIMMVFALLPAMRGVADTVSWLFAASHV